MKNRQEPTIEEKLTEILEAFDIANADSAASFEEVTKQAIQEIIAVFGEG